MNQSISFNKKRTSLFKPLVSFILFIIISIFIFFRFQTKLKSTNPSLLLTKNTSVHIPKPTIIPSQIDSRRCIIYIFHRAGRLGNRMFILATGYGLARIHSCYLYISYSILNEIKSVFVFNLQNLLLSHTVFESIMKNRSHPMEKITREIGCRYLPELTHPNAISQGTIFEMRGYWQTYLHFANYTNELREHIFVANESVLEKVAKFFLDLYQRKFAFAPQFSLENHPSLKKQLAQSNHTTWIGIHVRRSDFVWYKLTSSDEYVFNAIEYYTRRYPNAHFVVASDDKSYCKKLFHDRSNVFLTPRSFSPGDDLITLSLCQHSIITGGTFGWWTAYLANGEVVHDTAYPTTCEKDEYYYPSWFKSDLDIILDKHTS